jgi:DUF971 family protein
MRALPLNEKPSVEATEIKLRTRSRLLEVSFADGQRFELPFEYLRVNSPSAEVRGHGAGETLLVLGKENVLVKAVEPIGHYAVRLVFDDGHNTGLYTWQYLYELGSEYPARWAEYRARQGRGS